MTAHDLAPLNPAAPRSAAAAAAADAAALDPRRRESRLVKRLLGPFYVTGIFWVRAIVVISRAPEWVAQINIFVWTCFFFVTLRRARQTTLANLEPLLGKATFWQRQQRVWRTFHNHAWFMLERFEQYRPRFDLRLELEGHVWQDIARSAQGWVLVSAHFGNWEVGPLMPLRCGNRRLHVVREREEHPVTQRYLEQLLATHPRGVFDTHFVGAPGLGIDLLMTLRRGDVVTMAGDRPRPGGGTLRVPLLGRSVRIPEGPLALARAADVAVVPVFSFRRGRRHYRLVAREPFRVERSGERRADLQRAGEHLAREVEWAIRSDPHHWARWETVWEAEAELPAS